MTCLLACSPSIRLAIGAFLPCAGGCGVLVRSCLRSAPAGVGFWSVPVWGWPVGWFGLVVFSPFLLGWPSAVCFLGVVVLASAAAAALHQCAVYLGAVHFTKSTQNKCHCHWCFLDICLGSSSYIGCLRLSFRGSVGESSAISHVFFSAQPPLSQDQKGFKSLRQSWELLGLRERNTLVGRPSRGWTFFDVSRMTQLEH